LDIHFGWYFHKPIWSPWPQTKIAIFTVLQILFRCYGAIFSLFNTHAMHIKSLYTTALLSFPQKNLSRGGIRTRILFFRWMRCLLRHTALHLFRSNPSNFHGIWSWAKSYYFWIYDNNESVFQVWKIILLKNRYLCQFCVVCT
jgi:hypothetical protein